MVRIKTDNPVKQDIYKFVCQKLDMKVANSLTMGVFDKEDNFLAGVVYFLDNNFICHMTIVAEHPIWALPKTLSELLRIAFNLLKAKIVKFEVSHKNKRIIRFLTGLNMVKEGLLRYNRLDGTHEIVFSLTEKEFIKKRWYRK